MTAQEQLLLFKALLGESEQPSDLVYQFYLDSASDLICDIRNSDKVEPRYQNVQVKIAIEMYNKRGVEGQTGHGENGIDRAYENSGISKSLIDEITPVAKTPFSTLRIII